MKIRKTNYPYYEHKYINNLQELLDLSIEQGKEDIAFSYSNINLVNKTYEDFYSEVKNVSAYFNNKYKNKHIGLIGENSYNFLVIFFGIILSGNICVIFDKDSDLNTLKKLMNESDTKILYYSKNYCNFIDKLKCKSYEIDNIDYLILEGSNKINKNKIDDDKDAVIFFTSGTTGPNKGVVLSQKNMASNIYGASSLFKPSGKVVSILPYHHAFGLVTSVLKPFYYHEEVYINSSLKDILNDFKKVKPDTLFVVPAFIDTFYKQIWRNARKNKKERKLKIAIKTSNYLMKMGIDLRKRLFKNILESFGGNLNYIICGGARLDKKYVKWFRSIGIEMLNGYGITECSPVVSVNRNNYYKDGSIGLPCRGLEVKIIDNEICVKGPSVMKCYYKDKKSTNEVIKEGYFHTGDLGYIDKDGFIFINGRKKNLIILSNGENISPEVIENEISKDDAVSEIVVYESDNKLIAYIYPVDEYIGDEEYFENLIYNYNKDKAKNHQIALVKLRATEFVKNNNKKILRDRIGE